MWNDDDDDDFRKDDDELSEEEMKKFEWQRKEKYKAIHNHPLYILAVEIMETVNALNESIVDEQDRQMYEMTLTESSLMLAPKIAGAMGSGSRILSLQNAAIIRYHAEFLLTSTSGLKSLDSVDKKYVQLLREDMIEFRTLFKEWVKEIKKMKKDDYEDEWGLYTN
ncbi:MAG: hypothetical protein K0S44_1915 [Bacteroidetes bacterium]|jgi:hypothetical protein|nr:hypothetical protein [Bacteroidota bacterium]